MRKNFPKLSLLPRGGDSWRKGDKRNLTVIG
jgi:hypothetical protein